MPDHDVSRTEDALRAVLAGLKAVDAATASSPWDPADVGDLLRGLFDTVGAIAAVPSSSKDGTGISRDGVRILLERYPRDFGSLLVRSRTEGDTEEMREALRRNAVALGVTVDSILSSSTFRRRAATGAT